MANSLYVSHLSKKCSRQKWFCIIVSLLMLSIARISFALPGNLGQIMLRQVCLDAEVAYLKALNSAYKRELNDLMPPCMEQEIFEATAYEPSEVSCGKWAKHGLTKTQTVPAKFRTIAVDPEVIPLGSIVMISGLGVFVAEDTGSAIKGRKVDIFVDSVQQALEFGRKDVVVYYQNKACFDSMVKEAKHDSTFNFLAFQFTSEERTQQ